MKLGFAAGAIALTAVVVAACSSNPSSSTTARTTSPQGWTVAAGSSGSNEALQALAFYPSSITIDAGDTVTWTTSEAEPHTIAFPIPGTTPVPGSDPSAQAPVGGSTFDGSTYVSSGFIAGGAKYALTFPKPGIYTYYSLPQGFVAGTVNVQPAGVSYPANQAAYAASAQSGIASDLAAAKQSIATIPFASGSHIIAAGVSPSGAAPTNSTVMRYMDGPTMVDDLNVTVAVGGTLTFKNLSNNVPHTVTFPAAGQSPPPGSPGQAAVGGSTYDGTTLVNSGVIPPGGSYALTFTKAGTFTYYCLFHEGGEGMIGSVTVTP